MGRPDGSFIRFLAWIGLATAVCLSIYQALLVAFFQTLNGSLEENFGTAFPAIPVVALLAVLFVLRWGDLRDLLIQEHGLTTEPPVRALGLGLVLMPLIFEGYSLGSLPASAISLILVFYGTALLVNPSTKRILLPYTVLYISGVAAPFVLEYYVGEPFVGLATYISAGMVRLSGIPVTWQGDQFQLVSRIGGQITATVTPGCSSILSVTTFLGLLGLMHFDMRKPLPSTLKVAVVGVFTLIILNSVRILLLIWAGYSGGAAALWGLHNWVGYALFVGFYLAFLVIYTRMGGDRLQSGRATQTPVGPL